MDSGMKKMIVVVTALLAIVAVAITAATREY